MEDYKRKLIKIYPDAFDTNKNDYRKKMEAITELERLENKQIMTYDKNVISQIQHNLD